ncbi:cyclin-T1-2-like isoform X2 [Andrographis paniculata]|uniref:cyclin-T1-2-like isoform X2 n=1 Tax=Andrographis paniculata TaxID=175694 RepID=UPI0021E8E8C8|nr:cyclin-T1-2-like isoform X2 [Andrographis paniculata]
MSLVQYYQPRGGHSQFQGDGRSLYGRNCNMGMRTMIAAANGYWSYDNNAYSAKLGGNNLYNFQDFTKNDMLEGGYNFHAYPDSVVPPSKRRKISAFSSESTGRHYQHQYEHKSILLNNVDRCEHPKPDESYCNDRIVCHTSASGAAPRFNAVSYSSTSCKRDRSKFEDDEVVFMSRDEIERCSPSRRDGIDPLHEAHLRYSYCAFLQNLGVRLDLPQTTIATAMVLCHRFFLRRSHAAHDRFMIATAVLFLASKSEETPRPLNDVLRVSCETLHKQDFTILSYMLPIDWFEQYRERITEAEQLVLTTLNFELNVQHPYDSLTDTLQKLGFSQSLLVNLALNFVSEGIYRGLACTPFEINSWRLMCCAWNVLFFI